MADEDAPPEPPVPSSYTLQGQGIPEAHCEQGQKRWRSLAVMACKAAIKAGDV
jgi:hypothetical protein